MSTFRKQRRGSPADYYAIEAAGLKWLKVAQGPEVAEVIEVASDHLELQRIVTGSVSATERRDFGARLAHLHATPASAFGCPPDGVEGPAGYIADLPLPFGHWDSFGPFYAEARIAGYLRLLDYRGELSATDHQVFGDLRDALNAHDSGVVGPPAPPSRIHGDLWSGNIVWGRPADAPHSQATGWLIDPAAHGGHRETDLAMLALFGQAGIDEILAGYQNVTPLDPGWEQRISLHQVHPLLVHAVLFGGGYLSQAARAARSALNAN